MSECQTETKKKHLNKWKKENEFAYFARAMFEEYVFTQEALNVYLSEAAASEHPFVKTLIKNYRTIFEEEFLPQHVTEEGEVSFDTEAVSEFAKKSYKVPVPNAIKRADTIFKELFRGHAPRVLAEYMFAQFEIRGINAFEATDEQIREIAEAFDQKNVAKIAKYKNLVLFALADRLNFNEVKSEHLMAFATFVDIHNLNGMVKR